MLSNTVLGISRILDKYDNESDIVVTIEETYKPSKEWFRYLSAGIFMIQPCIVLFFMKHECIIYMKQ